MNTRACITDGQDELTNRQEDIITNIIKCFKICWKQLKLKKVTSFAINILFTPNSDNLSHITELRESFLNPKDLSKH